MARSVGQVKDTLAALMFLVSLIILLNTRVPYEYIISLVLMGLAVDGLFTINQEWHCQDWETSATAKYIVLAQIPVFCVILTRLYF